MKLTGTGESLTTNINDESKIKKCGVKAGAAAWKIMTDNLYAYKERAIMRELATNCIDALRKAGQPLNNWELTIPNSSSNVLIFEDHGAGMNDDDIGVYTTLFDSTKSDSNDETGMFGLGAKTPFAYTKQFFVESSKDGFKNIYDIHLAGDGCPECIKINPAPIPTDKTGTKITINVKNEDYDKFYEGLAISAVSWPGLPVIHGGDDFYYWLKSHYYLNNSGKEALTATNLIYQKSKLPARDYYSYRASNNSFVLEMGSVIYKISNDYSISSKVGDSYVIHANIGDVDIQPSREELQYSDKTNAYLEKMIPSTFILSIDVPAKEDGYEKIQKFFATNEAKLISEVKVESLTAEAKLKYKEIEDLKAYALNKLNALVSKITKEILVPYSGWLSKLENNPFGKALSVCSLEYNKSEIVAQHLLEALEHTYVGFINLSEKDKKHIKVKQGGVIDAAYFLPKYYSAIKDKNDSNWKQKGVFIFSDSEFTEFVKADKWYGMKDDVEVLEFSEMKNTYVPAASNGSKPKKKVDAWKDVSAWDWALYGNWQTRESGRNDPYNRFASFITQADKILLYPKFRNRTIICNVMDLETKPFNQVSCQSSYYTPELSILNESEEKIIVLSGSVSSIQSCKLFKLGWKSLYTYLADFLKENREKAIESYVPCSFKTYRIFEGISDSFREKLSGTKFEKILCEYETQKAAKESSKDYTKYFNNNLDRLCRYESSFNDIKNLYSKFENKESTAEVNEDLFDKAEKTYPLLSLFNDKIRYEKGWNYKCYYETAESEYGAKFADYVKMVDNQ